MYAPTIDRDHGVKLDENERLFSLAEDHIASGALFDASNDNFGSEMIPFLPLSYPLRPSTSSTSTNTSENNGKIKTVGDIFTSAQLERFIPEWLQLWFKARRKCLKSDFMSERANTYYHWRPFLPIMDLIRINEKNFTPLAIMEQRFETVTTTAARGIYLPLNTSEESECFYIVFHDVGPRMVVVAVDTKYAYSSCGLDSKEITQALTNRYESITKHIQPFGWGVGYNAYYFGIVLSDIDYYDEIQFHESCPHGRLLHGDQFKDALGPTMLALFKHWRVIAATAN